MKFKVRYSVARLHRKCSASEWNNVNLFTPNKDFVLSFQELDKHKLYSGYYRLSGMSYSLVRDGDTFRVTTGVILKKSPVVKW